MDTNSGTKLICIDVANGYREVFLDFVKRVRKEFSSSIIIAGNVATREMTEALILAGADIVKVGIGPGSVCTTRKVAGVGYLNSLQLQNVQTRHMDWPAMSWLTVVVLARVM